MNGSDEEETLKGKIEPCSVAAISHLKFHGEGGTRDPWVGETGFTRRHFCWQPVRSPSQNGITVQHGASSTFYYSHGTRNNTKNYTDSLLCTRSISFQVLAVIAHADLCVPLNFLCPAYRSRHVKPLAQSVLLQNLRPLFLLFTCENYLSIHNVIK